MVKHTRRKLRRHRKSKKQRRHSRKYMKGGDYTPQQLGVLQNSGFSQYQIQRFEDMGLTYEQIDQKIQEIMGEGFSGNSDDFADEVEQALFQEHMNQGIPHADDDEHHMDMDDEDSQNSLHLSDLQADSFVDDEDSQGSLHLSDLQADSFVDSEDGYTTNEDESFVVGGIRKRRTIKKRKGRKTHKKHGRKHGRKTRRQRGGTCYGNGVGANSYDPNFSIYNTRELQLFPYKPTN